MDKRTAKREALHDAAKMLFQALDSGYANDEPNHDDGTRLREALYQIADRLEIRSVKLDTKGHWMGFPIVKVCQDCDSTFPADGICGRCEDAAVQPDI